MSYCYCLPSNLFCRIGDSKFQLVPEFRQQAEYSRKNRSASVNRIPAKLITCLAQYNFHPAGQRCPTPDGLSHTVIQVSFTSDVLSPLDYERQLYNLPKRVIKQGSPRYFCGSASVRPRLAHVMGRISICTDNHDRENHLTTRYHGGRLL